MKADDQKQIEWDRQIAVEAMARCLWGIETLRKNRQIVFVPVRDEDPDLDNVIEDVIWSEDPPHLEYGRECENQWQIEELTACAQRFAAWNNWSLLPDATA